MIGKNIAMTLFFFFFLFVAQREIDVRVVVYPPPVHQIIETSIYCKIIQL